MDDKENQEIYLKQFIQKQENMLLDFLRKNIDLDIRYSALSLSLKDITSKYEESQKQVTIQNEIMQQAATGVESLTIEKKKFEQKEIDYNKTIDELKKSLHDCKNEREKITKQYNEELDKMKFFDKKYGDLEEEYNRQTQELSELFRENQELKSKLPINKSKAKKETAILPPDEF